MARCPSCYDRDILQPFKLFMEQRRLTEQLKKDLIIKEQRRIQEQRAATYGDDDVMPQRERQLSQKRQRGKHKHRH